MQSRNRPNSNFNSEAFRPESIRKVGPNDKFPCFACFDHPKERLDCRDCHGAGWVLGSHPMVQFAEDFIEKRLGGLLSAEMATSTGPYSEGWESNGRMSSSEEPTRKPREVVPSSLARTVDLGDQLRPREDSG
jgi:hypothetical protein